MEKHFLLIWINMHVHLLTRIPSCCLPNIAFKNSWAKIYFTLLFVPCQSEVVFSQTGTAALSITYTASCVAVQYFSENPAQCSFYPMPSTLCPLNCTFYHYVGILLSSLLLAVFIPYLSSFSRTFLLRCLPDWLSLSPFWLTVFDFKWKTCCHAEDNPANNIE